MRESRADNAQAIGLSLLLHAVLFALMFFGLWWSRSAAPISAAGSPISAELIDADALSQATRRALAERPEPVAPPEPEPEPEPAPQQAAPPPQPLPEPRPQESPVPPQPQAQQQIPDPDVVDQDEARRDAISELQAEREQQEKRRQEQIDLTERQRQEEAERKQRLTEMEQERQKQLADIRRQRERAAREAQLAEQKLKQLEQLAERRAQSASEAAAQADAAASAPPGNAGSDDGLSARYAAALQEAILRNWTRPDTVPLNQRCRIVIRQIPGGQVIDAKVDPSCPYDDLGRRSVEAAVLKAQPLPYAGFEAVFQRTLILNFQAQDR